MAAKLESLNKNHLFARAYRSKLCFVSPFVITYVVRRRTGGIRIGITAGKKVGCAVKRNRARRIVRAAAVELLGGSAGNFDIVFVCRAAALAKKSTFIREVIRGHLIKAGVLAGARPDRPAAPERKKP